MLFLQWGLIGFVIKSKRPVFSGKERTRPGENHHTEKSTAWCVTDLQRRADIQSRADLESRPVE